MHRAHAAVAAAALLSALIQVPAMTGQPGQRTTQHATLTATTPAVQGVDVSSMQHLGGAAIDWKQVAGAGYKFAFIKSTEGSYYVNPYYASDAAEARAAGLIVAPYHFAIPNYSGGAFQADYALDHSGYAADGATLPLVADLEYDPYAGPGGDGTPGYCYGLSPSQMVAWIAAFVAETHRRTGLLPAIYTTANWWSTCTGDSPAFAADPLWIAGNNSTNTAPIMPAAWQSWTYWQYTSAATVPGISGNVDASYLGDSALELAHAGSQSYQAGAQVSLTAHSLSGTQPVSYAASGLPGGLSVSASTGVVSGTLTGSPATFPSSITVSAPGVPAVTENVPWYIHGPVSIGRIRVRTGSVGSPVWLRVPATDSLPGCTLTFSATGLPPGVTMNSCGLITGWPAVSRRYWVTVRVTDSSGATLARRGFGWTILPPDGSGPAGHIKLSRDGKCLQELRPGDIAIERCRAVAAQRWTIAANGSIRINGGCLTASGTWLSVAYCQYSGQRWQLGSGGTLTDLTGGKCLTDRGWRNGARAIAATCYAKPNSTGSASTPSANQRWVLPAGPLTAGISGLCVSDWHRLGTTVGVVSLRDCNGTWQQNWTIEPDGTVRAVRRCLSPDGGRTAYGTVVRLIPCGSAAAQHWRLIGGPIGIELFNPAAGLCLADPGDRRRAGTRLRLGGCVAGDPGITWRVS